MPCLYGMQTLSEENYLKIIYNLDKQGLKKITPTAISEALNNNPASVVDMIKKLVDKKLLQYEKSKGVKLTEKGGGHSVLLEGAQAQCCWEAVPAGKIWAMDGMKYMILQSN